jgi:competence protein ComEC
VAGEVWFLDVGQGHAAVVAAGDEACVIDCPARGVAAVLGALSHGNPSEVAAIFVTHRDLDHCGGIPKLLDSVKAGVVYLNLAWALPPESSAKVRVKAVLSSIFSKTERDAIPLRHAYRDDTGNIGEVRWQVLAPTAYDAGRASLNDETNRASMVILFAIGARRFLILGDADHITLAAVLSLDWELHCDVLLASHHGAHLTNFDAVLERVQPAYAIISVGNRNPYGHPHETTLARLAGRSGCRIMCTQVNRLCQPDLIGPPSCAGSVHFRVTGEALDVEPDVATHQAVIERWSSPRCVPSDQITS